MPKYVSVAEMVNIEKAADAKGLTYPQMMENAGQALADVILDAYLLLEDKKVVGLVGKGNNGGDTLIALTKLVESGWEAAAYLVEREDDELTSLAQKAGVEVLKFAEDKSGKKLKKLIGEKEILLDGLLGTGIKLPLREPMPKLLKQVSEILEELEHPPDVIAVDCPSGIDCDTGEAAEETLYADLTVCMAAVKQGLLAFPAFEFIGDLVVVGIGLPDSLNELKAVKRFVPEQNYVDEVLPERPLNAHKGTFGTALIVAGSTNYTGAVYLAGQAAYRCGTGLVTMAIPAAIHDALAGSFPEATWVLLPHEMGVISAKAAEIVSRNLERISAMLIGPGFGLEDTSREFIENLLGKEAGEGRVGLLATQGTQTQRALPPLVLDADGLKLLSQIKDWDKRLPSNSILTPHPGEMSVLTGLATQKIQEDRLGTAEKYAKKWGHIVTLKGAFTVIASPDGRTAVLPLATPALARAGTGDVLAGLIAGLRAQGMEAFEAGVAGAWLHAQAGLAAAELLGSTAGVLAGDLLDEIPDLMPR